MAASVHSLRKVGSLSQSHWVLLPLLHLFVSKFFRTDDTKGSDGDMRISVSIPFLWLCASLPLEKKKPIFMAPFLLPTANGSSSTSANATSASAAPRPVPCQPVNQNQWGPDAISNIVFGLVMVFISLFAIYQTRKQRPRGSSGESGDERQMDVRSC